MPASARARNPRGQGANLRGEIVAAAGALLDEGGEEAITLRAVARRAGITAPAIYPHFADREAILAAVSAEAFGELVERMRAASRSLQDPRARLVAVCRTVVLYATERPARYHALVAGDRVPGAEAFVVLLAAMRHCIADGISSAPDPLAPAMSLWIALHGYVSLRGGSPGFPWPDGDGLLDRMIARLAQFET